LFSYFLFSYIGRNKRCFRSLMKKVEEVRPQYVIQPKYVKENAENQFADFLLKSKIF
jgi:hypothetical protein